MITMEKPNAARRRKRAGLLIRRIPDENGKLVTYLAAVEVCRMIECSPSTLRRWMRMNAIRSTDKLVGMRNASVADAARLKRMTPKESMALGIRRIPADELRGQEEWFQREQYETRKRATHHKEAWDDYDVNFVITCVREGRPLDIVAKALGRTYASVCSEVDRLRKMGEIEQTVKDDAWWIRTRVLLTTEEVAELEA